MVILAGTKGWQTMDQRATVDYVNKVHTPGLNPELPNLKNAIIKMMERAVGIIDDYNKMAEMKVTLDLVKRIRSSYLTKKVLPESLQTKKIQVPKISVWNLYNDITDKIWHSEKQEMATKLDQFKALHDVLEVRI